ncbi:MAG: hypothetical protein NUV77_20180, partial [Thermoguttaceae bacterium]|nr:hypothetical protein [Thermoguttaceae bacterium]
RRGPAGRRAALAELRVRGYCDFPNWLAYVQPNPPNPATFASVSPLGYLDARESYAIDPLYIAKNFGADGLAQFPFNHVAPNTVLQWSSPAVQWTMPRVSIQHAGLNPAIQAAVFDRIFTWQDDTVFGRPAEQDRRAVPMFIAGATGPERWSIEGRYSWMATVSPAPGHELPPSGMLPPRFSKDGKQTYRVSVVVFDSRYFDRPGSTDLESGTPPEERWANVVGFPSAAGGVSQGGGDVVLECDTSVPGANDPSWLRLRQGEWLMLAGLEAVPGPPNPPAYYRKVFRWYRIVSVGEPDSANPLRRQVTLAGPDWMMNWNVGGQAKAALFTGVVGVYTETVEVER